MCVICIKPSGKEMPSKRVLKAMYDANPHGCGFACKSDYFRSMDFEEFYERIKNVPKKENCIIHFRLATHGSRKVENCHPFKEDNVYFAHNGILDVKPIGDTTDSETAFRTLLLPCMKEHGIKSKVFKSLNFDLIDGYSKFAYLVDGAMYMFGDFQKYGDYFVSNKRFLPYLFTSRQDVRYANLWVV